MWQTLLAQLHSVQPSDKGILDGESQDNRHLRELDTDSDPAAQSSPNKKARRQSVAAKKSKGKTSNVTKQQPKLDTDMVSPSFLH